MSAIFPRGDFLEGDLEGAVKKLSKTKMEVVKPPSHLFFKDSLSRRDSIYTNKLTEAVNTDSVILVLAADKYVQTQFKNAAKKLSLRLVFAEDGENVYIKPLAMTTDQKRLMLLLREPRTLAELQGSRLELHLPNTLADFAAKGIAHIVKDKWVLTPKGVRSLNP